MLGPHNGPRENLKGRRMEIRLSFDSRTRKKLNLYNFGRDHIITDCRGTKCFECGKYTTFCQGKQEKLLSAGCAQFGHRKEECNMSNYNNSEEWVKMLKMCELLIMRELKGLICLMQRKTGEQNMEYFGCRKGGNVTILWQGICNTGQGEVVTVIKEVFSHGKIKKDHSN
ncbi:unnamed protein product [Gordionus sp. m RMFG-2023]